MLLLTEQRKVVLYVFIFLDLLYKQQKSTFQ